MRGRGSEDQHTHADTDHGRKDDVVLIVLCVGRIQTTDSIFHGQNDGDGGDAKKYSYGGFDNNGARVATSERGERIEFDRRSEDAGLRECAPGSERKGGLHT